MEEQQLYQLWLHGASCLSAMLQALVVGRCKVVFQGGPRQHIETCTSNPQKQVQENVGS